LKKPGIRFGKLDNLKLKKLNLQEFEFNCKLHKLVLEMQPIIATYSIHIPEMD
jgi:hypothetical protein